MIPFPHTVDNFLTKEENDTLLNFSKHRDDAFEECSRAAGIAEMPGQQRWLNKVCHYPYVEMFDSETAEIVEAIGHRMADYMVELLPFVNTSIETWQFSRWSVGDHLDPGHADNCNPDGSDNFSPWRNYGMVLYLNGDFEGGELYYPNCGTIIKPKPAMLAVHTANQECMHAVKEVKSGTRHTLISFASYDQQYIEENTHAFCNRPNRDIDKLYKERYGN
jgi:hypothetical protein